MSRVATVFIAASALKVAGPLVQAATKTLTKPDAVYADPFTILEGVRELKDGRVIAVDPREKTVQVIDFKTGGSSKLGREGGGPGEYGLPQRALALSGDSTAIADVINNRLLVVEPNGKLGGFLEMPGAGGGGRGGFMMMGGLPRQSDGHGGLYYSTPGIIMTDNGPKTADSSAIVRWRPALKKVDTVAFLALPKDNAQVTGGRGNMNVRIGGGTRSRRRTPTRLLLTVAWPCFAPPTTTWSGTHPPVRRRWARRSPMRSSRSARGTKPSIARRGRARTAWP
ncbi:MAG: hypothetical protein U0163_12575 [Gemmatimonadaceae bacterium]